MLISCCVLALSLSVRLCQADDSPLIFQHDRNDGRIVWINNQSPNPTSQGDTVSKIEFRSLTRDANNNIQPGEGEYQQLTYNANSPVWQKPRGLCGEYDLKVTMNDGGTYQTTLERPVPQLRADSKLKAERLVYDPQQDRVLVQTTWSPQFDYWTGAGVVLTTSPKPWAKLLSCQSIFRNAVPPPTMESNPQISPLMVTFDPEYVRNNCSFILGFNASLRSNSDPNCLTEYSSLLANDSLILNVSCATVVGAAAYCMPPARADRCQMDCSPMEAHTEPMGDNVNEYVKLYWSFPDYVQKNAKRYQVRYAEANVTPWNTLYNEREAAESTVGQEQNYVEVKNVPNGFDSPTNFSVQVCAVLSEEASCTTPIEWIGQRKYFVTYAPRYAPSALYRRRGRNAAIKADGNSVAILVTITCMVYLAIASFN